MNISKSPLTALIGLVSALSLVACANPPINGGTNETPEAAQIAKPKCDPDLSKALPKDFHDRDLLKIATNSPFPPFVKFNSSGDKELVGLDVDLGTAIGEKLCIPVSFSQQPFDGLITGLEAEKYDAVMAGIFATSERAKSVRFVTYAQSGTAIMVRASDENTKNLQSLCGRTVATQNGATQVDLLTEESEKCQETGKGSISVRQFPQFSDERLALTSGKVDAIVHDLQALNDGAKDASDVKVISDPSSPGGYDIQQIAVGVNTDSPELQEAIAQALLALKEEGVYDQIFEKWDASALQVETPGLYASEEQ